MNRINIIQRILRYKDIITPYLATVALLLIFFLMFPTLFSVTYVLQQLQIASFLGIIATGSTLVIILGHIDLSVPWTFTGSAIIATILTGTNSPVLQFLAFPLALLFGACVGLINGIGVSILRIPSIVWTLAINSMLLGIAVLNTGGYNPQGQSSPLMQYLAKGYFAGIPTGFWLWMMLSVALLLIMKKTPFGKYLCAIGYSEKASFLSGISTTQVIMLVFVIAGFCSALSGIVLAGYANQAYQSMGDPYMMPNIAAVVIGGTSILGGRGSVIGTIGGAIFITMLTSMLSLMQMSEAWRQIIFGLIIILMVLIQKNNKKLL